MNFFDFRFECFILEIEFGIWNFVICDWFVIWNRNEN